METLEDRLAPALTIWDGASTLSSNWTDGANWQGNIAPTPGDSLVFPPSAVRLNNTNDFAAGTSFGSIQISGTGYTLGGNLVDLGSGVSSAGTNTLNLPLQLTAGQGIAQTASGTLTLGATVNLNGNALTLDTGVNAIQVTGSGTLTGNGSLTQAGSGTLTLADADSYTGTTTVGGTLIVQNGAALGSGDGLTDTATTLAGNATLWLQNSITVSNHLLNVTGSYSNAGLVGSGNDVWTGNVSFGNPSTYNVLNVEPSTGNTLELDGSISNTGDGYLQFEGSGRTILTGSSSLNPNYYSSVSVAAGTVEVDGSLTEPYNVYVNGGTLSGTGTVTAPNLDVDGYGTLQPGTASVPGTLTLSGPLLFSNSNNAVHIAIDGASVGQYDEVNAQGTVSLSGTALNVSFGNGFVPTVGDTFTILHSTAPIAGTFSGLAQGSLFVVGSTVLQISYTGGTGDDIVLTVVPATVWTGASNLSSNWSDAANWLGGVAPVAGDNLIFPAGAAQLSNTNDFPTGTAFGAILISGAGYTLGGNPVDLGGGVSSAGTNALDVPLQLTAGQGIAQTASGTLTVGAAIDLNGYALTLDTGGNAIAVSGNGTLSGSGSLTQAGSGTLTLANADSYTGTTTVGGTLIVQNGAALGSGDGLTDTATTLAGNATLWLQNSITVSNHLLNVTGSYSNAGLVGSGNDVWTGNVSFGNPSTYNVLNVEPSTGNTLELDGSISNTGDGYLQFEGSGRTILTGSSSLNPNYYSSVSVAAGTVEVDGSLTEPYNVYVNGGTLSGTGTVTAPNLDVDGYGTLQPGTASVPGTLTLSGPLLFSNSNNAVHIAIDGASVGQYDEVNAQGTVSLSGTALNVSFGNGFVPTVGDTFTILHSTAPIAGTFSGLAQGSLFVVGSTVLQISYTGGTGDDIVLTVVPATVWTGASNLSSNWSDAANWLGGVAPVAGDNLIFPAGAAQLSNTNDFPTGTAFGAILISGAGYTLGGNPVDLGGGVSSAGTNALDVPLQLTAGQGIAQTASGTLTVGAAIDLNGYALTLDTGGNAIAVSGNGTLSGSGSLTQAGSGTLTLANADSYTGTTTVGGTLIVQNGAALGSGDGLTDTATTLAGNATLWLQNSITVSNHLLNVTGSYSNAGLVGSGNDVWTGNVSFGNPSTYNVLNVEPSTGNTLELDGSISNTGDGYLQFEGSGRTILTGSSSLNPNYYSSVSVAAGTVEVDGSLTEPYNVYVNGGTLSGTGTVTAPNLDVDGYGTLQPGTASVPGTLTLSGPLLFSNSNNAVHIAIDGASVGQYDEVNAQGTVSLSGTALNVSFGNGFLPTLGQTFTILHSTAPIAGTFNGLPEGSTFLVGSTLFKISYVGGTGNDIVLTAQTGQLIYTATTGSPTSYTLRLNGAGTMLQLVDGSNNVLASQPLGNTTSVAITGHAGGSDTLTIDFSNGAFSVPDGVSFNGGGSGTLKVTGGTFQDLTESLTGPGAGTMLFHPASGADLGVSYSGLLPVDSTGTIANNLVFNLPAGSTDAILDDTGVPAGDMTLRFSSHSSEDQIFADPSGSLTINTSGGNSLVQLGTPDAGFAPSTIALSGSAGDTFQLTDANALPSTSTLKLSTATLDLNGLSPTIDAFNGNGTVTNDAAGAATWTVGADGGTGSFSGVIQDGSGTVDLTKTGAGTETLSGNNAYSGATTIGGGTLSISSDGNLGTVPASATPGQLVIDGGTLQATASFTLSSNRGIALGPIAGSGAGTIDVTSGQVLTYGGIIGDNGGTGAFATTDTGTLILTGASNYSGTTTIGSGTLEVDGFITSSVTNSGTLQGAGTITGDVSGDGVFAPGNPRGIMTIDGNFTPTGTVIFEVDSPYVTAGTDYSQFVVSGAVDLSGATLNFTNTSDATAPAVNSVLTLISGTSAGATVPSSGPADGATVTIGSRTFDLFYNGGDGNDVVLVEATQPSIVHVNGTYAGDNPGQVVAGSLVFGVNAFATVQDGVNAVAADGTVNVAAGTYAEKVSIAKDLTLAGVPGSPTSVVIRPSSGDGITIAGPASVTVEDLEVSGAVNAINASGIGTLNLADLVLTGNTDGGTLSNVTTVNETPSSGSTPTSVTLNGSSFASDSNQAIGYSNVANFNVFGSSASDTFDVTPAASTTFTIHGDGPPPPASPGDTLDLDLSGATSPTLTDTYGPAAGYTGAWTFGNLSAVNFDTIETLEPTADLNVTQTVSANATEGQNVTYTITVTNNGPDAATNVILSDLIPAGTTFVSSSFSGYDPIAGQVNLGTIGVNGSATGTIVVVPADEGTITNTANVASDLQDAIPADDTNTLGPTTVADADLTGSNGATTTGGVEGVTAATLSNATFTDANTFGSSSDFSVTAVDWGDGSTDTTGLTVNGSGGSYTVNGAHLYAAQGPYNFTITVTDLGGKTATITGTATAANVLAGSSGATATGGIAGVTAATLSNAAFTDAATSTPSTDFTVTAVDWGDGSTDTTGLTVTGSGGTYSVSGTHLYTDDGAYNFTITVADSGGHTATITGTTTVADADLTGSSSATATGGIEGVTAATLGNATFTDANTSAPSTDFTVTAVAWGDGSTDTTGLTVTGSGGTYTVNGTHLYTEDGPYNFTITVTDNGGKTATITGTTTVADADLTGSGSATATGGIEGVTAATLGNATFTDANTSAPSTDFTVTAVAWGDGSTDTTGLTVTGSGGTYTVNGSHLYTEDGSYNFTITVSDNGGKTATITGTTTVADADLTGSTSATATGGIEGVTAATLSNATFTDANTSAPSTDFTVTAVAWGDGGTDTTGLTVTGSGGTYTVNGSHLYTEDGSYNFTITVSDNGGKTATITGTTTVADADLTGSSSATATGGIEGVTAATLSNATFTDANTSAPSTDFTVTAVAWGDGSTDTTGLTVTGSGGTYTVNGSHLYTEDGPYNFTITVSDNGGKTATITGTTTVADAPLTGSNTAVAGGTEGAANSSVLNGATFTDANPGDHSADMTAVINWGDNGPTSLGAVSYSGGTYTVAGTHTYADDGSYNISIAVTDDGGQTATLTGKATVADAALTATAGADINVVAAVSTGDRVVATFTDANPGNHLADFTAVVNWGDGTGNLSSADANPTVSIVYTGDVNGLATYAVHSGHTFASVTAQGSPNAVTVTVTDQGGSSANATLHATVAAAVVNIATLTPPFQIGVGAGYVGLLGTFTYSNPNAVASEFTVGLYWGDGSSSLGQVLLMGVDALGDSVFGVYGFHTYYTAGNYTFAMGVYHGNAGAFATQFTLPGYVNVYQPSLEANLVAYNANLVNAYYLENYYLNASNQNHFTYQLFLYQYYVSVAQANLDAYNAAT